MYTHVGINHSFRRQVRFVNFALINLLFGFFFFFGFNKITSDVNEQFKDMNAELIHVVLKFPVIKFCMYYRFHCFVI